MQAVAIYCVVLWLVPTDSSLYLRMLNQVAIAFIVICN